MVRARASELRLCCVRWLNVILNSKSHMRNLSTTAGTLEARSTERLRRRRFLHRRGLHVHRLDRLILLL